jgi:hypothetical protein
MGRMTMKLQPKRAQTKLLQEEIGDGDRALRIKDSEFPLIFLSSRFADFGWDGYLIRNLKEYQKCLFNDEFTSLKPTFNAENLKKAKEMSEELLTKTQNR